MQPSKNELISSIFSLNVIFLIFLNDLQLVNLTLLVLKVKFSIVVSGVSAIKLLALVIFSPNIKLLKEVIPLPLKMFSISNTLSEIVSSGDTVNAVHPSNTDVRYLAFGNDKSIILFNLEQPLKKSATEPLTKTCIFVTVVRFSHSEKMPLALEIVSGIIKLDKLLMFLHFAKV